MYLASYLSEVARCYWRIYLDHSLQINEHERTVQLNGPLSGMQMKLQRSPAGLRERRWSVFDALLD